MNGNCGTRNTPEKFRDFRNKPQVIFFFFLTGAGERSFPIQTIFFLLMLHAIHLTVHYMAITEGNKCVLITRDPEL